MQKTKKCVTPPPWNCLQYLGKFWINLFLISFSSSNPFYFVGGVLHGGVDEDVEAGRDQDRGGEAEEEQQDQVVHQERLGGYPEIISSFYFRHISVLTTTIKTKLHGVPSMKKLYKWIWIWETTDL